MFPPDSARMLQSRPRNMLEGISIPTKPSTRTPSSFATQGSPCMQRSRCRSQTTLCCRACTRGHHRRKTYRASTLHRTRRPRAARARDHMRSRCNAVRLPHKSPSRSTRAHNTPPLRNGTANQSSMVVNCPSCSLRGSCTRLGLRGQPQRRDHSYPRMIGTGSMWEFVKPNVRKTRAEPAGISGPCRNSACSLCGEDEGSVSASH